MGCPECDAQYYRGTPLGEARHFAALSLGVLHKLRQALEKMDQGVAAFAVSRVIRQIDRVAEELLEDTVTH